MDNSKKLPNVLSFCTGYGGIELGLERTLGELNILAHVEIEAFAVANLVAKMEEGRMVPAPIWTNIKTFRPAVFRNHVDILTGGYPCQPFSAAGKRDGAKDPRHLWPWIRSAIKVIQPKMCFFENVEGHISLGLREVLTDLVNLGYRVENDCGEPTWGLFSAAEVGAPHQRKRVFILADSRSPELNRLPEPEERRENRTVGESGFELAKSRLLRPEKQEQQAGGVKQQSEELVNAERKGPQGAGYPGETRETISSPTNYQWPARPGQHQYEWEEPRVVNPKSAKRGRPCSQDNTGGRVEKTGGPDGTNGQNSTLKPGLDRTASRPGSRLDRLRLLGNGVVPATAEKAFRVLYGRITNPDKNYIQPSVQMEMFS